MLNKLLLAFLILCCINVNAQKDGIIGLGLSGGFLNYKGDLDNSLSMKFIKPGFGLHFLILPYSRFNFSLSYLHGKISCDDAKADVSNKYRNLNFYSYIDELSLISMFKFQDPKQSFSKRRTWVPYFFGGIAIFHFNPKTKRTGSEIELQKIGTEGQYLSKTIFTNHPSPYKLSQISFPFGVGVKYKIVEAIDIGVEIGLRKTFTDYLDDVSSNYPDKQELLNTQGATALYLSDPSNDPKRPNGRDSFSRRGNPDKKDWYTYSHINVTYYLVTKLYKSKQRYVF